MERVLPKHKVDLRKQQAAASGNYLRLLKLIPAMRDQNDYNFLVHIPGSIGCDTVVKTEVIERGPYTTLVRINQNTPDKRTVACEQPHSISWSQPVRMTVRIYHDAQMAEIVDFMDVRRFESSYDYPNLKMLLPDEKQQVNYFWVIG